MKLLVLSVVFTLLTGVAWGSAYTIGYRVHSLNMTPDQFIEQHSLGLDTHIILSLSAYAVLLMATIHAILMWFQNRELKKKQNELATSKSNP